MGAFIRDGHNLPGYIAAMPHADCEAVSFTYRPATAYENTEWLYSSEAITGKEKATRNAEFLSKHVVDWDLKDGAGSPVPINSDNCKRLHAEVQSKMLDIVGGWKKSDPKPDGSNLDAKVSLGN